MIAGIDEETLKSVLRENFSPSDHITTPERLFGREKLLKQIARAFNSKGRLIFIYGDRGVGKSSLALTAAHLQASANSPPIHVNCGESSTFESVVHAIGNRAVSVVDRFEKAGNRPSVGVNIAGIGGTFTPAGNPSPVIAAPNDLNEALDIIRYVAKKLPGQIVIIIDEFERMTDPTQKAKFAEFFKNFPDEDGRVNLIVCGISSSVEELLGAHPSAGRRLETMEVPRLYHDDLWKIITVVANQLDVEVGREALMRIGMISDGFPHYVHLIGDSLFYAMYDDEDVVTTCTAKHYKEGLDGALRRSEATYQSTYEKATLKTKNTEDYEAALWAMADHNDLKRQLSDIYRSYAGIVEQLNAINRKAGSPRNERAAIERTDFNARLQRLRGDGHAKILIGHGAGWFSFRENVHRGYVRLVAEQRGLQLAKDHHVPAEAPEQLTAASNVP